MEALIRDGIIKGDTTPDGRPTGNFRPDDNINRAEASAMALRAMDKYGRRNRQSMLSSADAIARVRALPEVKRWLATPSDDPACNERTVVGSDTLEDGVFYTVELMTICTGHNSASGWYQVNAKTGEIVHTDS